MKLPCECCAGIQIATPESEANRPGLPAIAYRVGTHATFLESMIARLSNLYLDVPAVDGSGSLTRLYPLKQLTTRDPSDPSIALLDAWAVVADVLSFYEERIANEGYLPTATERRSILELARLVGYKLRPGVSASVYLAFTVANAFQGVIPAGTRSQSIPGTGETAQFFETSYDLPARDTWNNLRPRLTRPQLITIAADPGTDAATRESLYFQGVATSLKPNDSLLFVFNEVPTDPKSYPASQQVLRFIGSVDPQPDDKRTEVVFQDPAPAKGQNIQQFLQNALGPFVDEADSIFSGSDSAVSVKDALTPLLSNQAASLTNSQIAAMISALIPQISDKHDLAVKRRFTRLAPWLARLLDILNALPLQVTSFSSVVRLESPHPPQPNASSASALGRLVGILDRVALAPSVQPANDKRLARSMSQAFSSQTDIAPRLLAAFRPAVASTIYDAWSGTQTPSNQVAVAALRVKASLFPGLYPGQTLLTPVANTSPTQYVATFQPPTIETTWGDLVSQDSVPLDTIALDAVYDKIIPDSWVAIDRPVILSHNPGVTRMQTYHKVIAVTTLTMATTPSPTSTATGYTAKVTQLAINPPWLQDLTSGSSDQQKEFNADIGSTSFLRGTNVYAQSESLALADEPIDIDIESDTIELDGVYEGLESGRWVIVSGERTDIPNTTGVIGNELVMIATVQQGTNAPDSAAFPSPNPVPFRPNSYTTDANRFGDRLVVGVLTQDGMKFIPTLPPPKFNNQMYRDQVQLAPGLFVNAYVPSDVEHKGLFPDFAGLLFDPETGAPYENGSIPPSRGRDGVFAWRISTQPVHTILTLANKLAYAYDASKVTVYGNVAKATHGQTVGEVLGDGDATQAFDTFALHQKHLTYVSAPTPDGAESTLVVRVNELEWHEASDLAGLGPRDHGYVTQTDDGDQTTAVFGTGEHAARVPTGIANIKATYRYGIGKPGNVQASQISQLATHPLGVQGVINPLAATGGADRDTTNQARRNAPVAVMALDRLVSTDDYAEFARTYAGIGKASAAHLSDGRRQLVHVTIAGAGDIPTDQNSDLYRNLIQSLLNFGDPYQYLQVCIRKVQLLVIAAAVQILPDYAWESVELEIRAAVLAAFSFDNRDLGQSAFLSELIAFIQNIKGVSYVDVQIFDSVAEDVTAAQLAGLATTLRRKPHVLAQLARLNPNFDPSVMLDPCQRVLPAELVFLSPDIPDTLILTQIGGA